MFGKKGSRMAKVGVWVVGVVIILSMVLAYFAILI